MRPHKRLKIWEKIMDVIERVYQLTRSFPRDEIYGLISQIKRASVSVASNIAEGAARRGKQEKLQFFSIAKGSLSEVDAQLEIALRLKFIKESEYGEIQSKVDEISRMIEGLMASVRRNGNA